MAEKKEKQYVSDNAQLMAEWDWDKNNALGLVPQALTLGSNKKAWWECCKGHEWQASIVDRNKGSGCPYCIGKKVLVGYNDLTTANPELAKEWNYGKNGNLKPEDFTVNSNKKVWWKCCKRHEWQAPILNRNKGNNCPYCSGRYAFKGETDLVTANPGLAKEWNYKKNGDLNPENFMPNSNKKVWWKCCKGHEWQATINNRSNGNACPICGAERKNSLPEFIIEYYLKKYGLEVMHPYKENGYELDIYIPSKKIAIEYDGYFWHKNKVAKDLEKNLKSQHDGIKLYRIREGLPSLNDSSEDYIIQKNQKDLAEIIQEILSKIVGFAIDVDLERDNNEIENLREYIEKENSLLSTKPKLAQEWHYEKNGNLRPEHILADSHKKAWWICNKGHEWQARISHRSNGSGCPFCFGRIAVKGENDLATVNPVLAEEWNCEKNTTLKVEDVTVNSGRKVWWKCGKGHEWQARINSRHNGNGCPFCSGRYAVEGETDLATINPELAKEWNYEKNGGLMPRNFTANSGKKVWWICNQGHEWQSTIANRNNGTGCPQCTKQKRSKNKSKD